MRETGFQPTGLPDGAGIQELYAALAADQQRNDLIFDDVVRAIEEKWSPILLTERRGHLEHFGERLRRFARHLVVLHGGMKVRERREVMVRRAAIPDGEERLLIATGRLHRLHPDKTEVRIFDYVDSAVPTLMKMCEKRLRGYRAIGYTREKTSLGLQGVKDEAVMEYDEDVRRDPEDGD